MKPHPDYSYTDLEILEQKARALRAQWLRSLIKRRNR